MIEVDLTFRRMRVVTLSLVLSQPAGAKVFLTTDEALKLSFPECAIERKTFYLTKEQQQEVQDLAAQSMVPALINPYTARCNGHEVATAYFDVHRVRTLTETLMVVVNKNSTIRRIEVLEFNEPEDYVPRASWYAQFAGKPLGPELSLKHDIRPVSGATLTAKATTDAVRRVLAIHQVVTAREKTKP